QSNPGMGLIHASHHLPFRERKTRSLSIIMRSLRPFLCIPRCAPLRTDGVKSGAGRFFWHRFCGDLMRLVWVITGLVGTYAQAPWRAGHREERNDDAVLLRVRPVP